MRGEKIYEYDLKVTGVTEYGISMDAILSGQVQVPPQGARFDVAFEGRAAGRLAGTVRGVDYARMRADGRVDLDIRATLESEAGHRIALAADGVAMPRAAEPAADLLEIVTLSTAIAEYGCVAVQSEHRVRRSRLSASRLAFVSRQNPGPSGRES